MKILNFSAVEILPALLNKTKTQTIRKAWQSEKEFVNKTLLEKGFDHELVLDARPNSMYVKPARFKVGEKVKIVWKHRTSPKGAWFDRTKGKELDITDIKSDFKCMCFPKILGVVEITEVFQIIMKSNKNTFDITLSPSFDYRALALASGFVNEESIVRNYAMEMIGTDFLQDMAKRDGFFGAGNMVKYFDKNYDLINPKKFWVYRFKWLRN